MKLKKVRSFTDSRINGEIAKWLGLEPRYSVEDENRDRYVRLTPEGEYEEEFVCSIMDFSPSTSVDQFLKFVAPVIAQRRKKIAYASMLGGIFPLISSISYENDWEISNASARIRCEAVLTMDEDRNV